MRKTSALIALAGIALAVEPSVAAAQQERLVRVVDWHVTPGQEAAFEAGRSAHVEYLAAQDHPFDQRVNRSQNNLVRQFVLPQGSWTVV